MTPEQVQTILHDFANRARLLRRRDDGSERWRFDVDGRAYDLHYYPDDDTLVRRYVGGATAAREFTQLQAMQKLHVPATRVVANLKGFRIEDRKGDATILVHDAAAVPLRAAIEAGRVGRLRLTASLIALLESLHRERLCPVPLTLDAFAARGDGVVIVRDGAMRFDGVVTEDRLRELDAATRATTTASERLRVWRHFIGASAAPRGDRAIARDAKRLARAANVAEEGDFATLRFERGDDVWIGRYVARTPLALPWSVASRAEFSRDDWIAALPGLIDGGGDATWQTFKSDDAAVVRGNAIEIAGARLDVVVKRPTCRPGALGWLHGFRGSRVRRTWTKTWRMLGLGFRCEVPLLVLDRRVRGRVVDQLLVVERVPGPTLAQADLDAMSTPARDRLLYAAGRVLREIERRRFTHRDAKSSNWIAWTDPRDGVVKPVLIDVDGVRFQPWRGVGVARLIRAMRTRADVTDADVEAIERGYRGERMRYHRRGIRKPLERRES